MSFRYKKRSNRTPTMNLDRLKPPLTGDDPPLTGWVHGIDASDLEERFARGLDNAGIGYKFKTLIPTAFSLPRESKELDFLVPSLIRPVEIDGEIGHKTSAQQAKDALRDAQLNPELRKMGYNDIKHILWNELETQELADRVARELI